MPDTVKQSKLTNFGRIGRVKHKRLVFKTRPVFRDSGFKMNTLAMIKNDKEIQGLIKPKFKIHSIATITRKINYSFAKKSYKKMQPDANGNIFLTKSFKTISNEVPTLLLNNNNDKIQNNNLSLFANCPPFEVVDNINMLNPTEYVIVKKDTIVPVNANENETKLSGIANNIPNNNMIISDNDNSWEFIENTNILRNTKYMVVKKKLISSANINTLTNENPTENQNVLPIESFEQTPILQNIPKEVNTVLNNKPKPKRKYTRRDPNAQTKKKIYTKREKNSIPKVSNRNKIGKSLRSTNNFLNLNCPIWKTPVLYTMTKSESPPTTESINTQNYESSVPISSQLLAQKQVLVYDADGKPFYLIPLTAVPLQENSSFPPVIDDNINSLVTLDNNQPKKEDDGVPESSIKDTGMAQATVFSKIAPKLSTSTLQNKRVVIRKKSIVKKQKASSLNKQPIIIQQSYDAVITNCSKQKLAYILPKVTPVPTPMPKQVSTPKPTIIPTPLPTPLPKQVSTPKPTIIPTPMPTPLPKQVSTPKPTIIPTPMPKQVSTPKPTIIPTPMSTSAKPKPTQGLTPIPVPTRTPLPKQVSTPKPSLIPTPMPTSATPKATKTLKPIPIPTPTPLSSSTIEDITFIDNALLPIKSTIMNDKVYSETMNKFPLILPKEVSNNNSGKQLDILERAIASINMDEFMPPEETNFYNTKPKLICTQSFDRSALSPQQKSSMCYLKSDPMLPQYSTRNL